MDKATHLFNFIASRQHTEFCWGQSDCALLAADWLKQYKSIDYAAEFRGRYTTYLGSRRILTKLGYQSLASAVEAQLGIPLTSSRLAQRGDIVIVDTDIGEAVGIVDGLGVMVQGAEGIEHVELNDILIAWRVE